MTVSLQVAQAYTCQNSTTETVFYDPSCSSGGMGCNAGGQGQNCRFCNFGPFNWPCFTSAVNPSSTSKPPGPEPEPEPEQIPSGSVIFTVTNNCPHEIWLGMLGRSRSNPSWQVPYKGGWQMNAGTRVDIGVPRDLDAARLWARTNCKDLGNGRMDCETGDCGFKQCSFDGVARGGRTPVTLAEFTLDGWGSQDYYDVSLVDGYNLMVTIDPKDKSSTHGSGEYWCKTPNCHTDLNLICPKELQLKSPTTGKTIACLSACERFNTDQYCCRGAHDQPHTCRSSDWPFNYPRIFKEACPTAYSYAYDDHTSTFFCKNTDYEITFC